MEVLGQDPFQLTVDNQQYPADLLVKVVSDSGAETYHQINEDLGLQLNGSPYIVTFQSNVEPELLKELEIQCECNEDNYMLEVV